MASSRQNKKEGNIFLRMHPLQRVLLSLGFSLIIFLLLLNVHFSLVLHGAILWDVFALTYIITSWIVFFTRPVADIAKQANKEDGSRLFVLISIIISSFASMFTVLLLLLSKPGSPTEQTLTIILTITGMLASWVMVHTIFTFHYAHLYYY